MASQPSSRRLLTALIRGLNESVHGRSLAERLVYRASLGALRRGYGTVRFADANGNTLLLHPQDVIDRSILLTGVWEPHVTEALRTHLHPGMVFYDVGANIGYDALLAARLVGPRGCVVAFEPNPVVARRLREHIAINQQPQVEVVEACVVAGDATTVTLYLPPEDRIQNPGRATVLPEHGFEPVQCKALRIDDRLAERELPVPDAVKIDVEGFELDVLRSMRSVIEGDRPLTIFLEVTIVEGKLDPSLDYLTRHRFEIERMSEPYRFTRDGVEQRQHDVVLVRA